MYLFHLIYVQFSLLLAIWSYYFFLYRFTGTGIHQGAAAAVISALEINSLFAEFELVC